MNLSSPVSPIRFGVFEISPGTGELRKQGLKVKLGQQAFKLLLLLLDDPEKHEREKNSANNSGRPTLLSTSNTV